MFKGPGVIILFIVSGSEDSGGDDVGGCDDGKAKYTKGLGSP